MRNIEKLLANRRRRAINKLEADALDSREIFRLLLKAGGKNVVRKYWADSEVFSTLVGLSANQAFIRMDRVLRSADIPYVSDDFPKKGYTEIEAVGDDVTTITNSYMCPDEDAGIILVVTGIGEGLSVVTVISRVY